MDFDFGLATENLEISNSGDVGVSAPETDLKKLTDAELGESTLRAAKNEKQATERLLEHLGEVERRFLFAAWGFSSLHDYLERGLGYLGSAANERVMASRLLRKVPAVKEALSSGSHTLTSVAMIGRHVKREALSEGEASALLERCEEKSSREIERILVEGSTQVMPYPEKVRAVSPELTRLTLEVDSEFMVQVQRMKELRGNPGATLSELFLAAMLEYTKKRGIKDTKERGIKAKGGGKPSEKSEAVLSPGHVDPSESPSEAFQFSRAPDRDSPACESPDLGKAKECAKPKACEKPDGRIRSRYIASSERNRVRKRAADRCEYTDPASGRRCASRTGLEFDHYPVPFARGGESTAKNLRVACRSHNAFHAVQSYGARKMSAYRKE
jgi:hypothetical protein